MIERGLPPWLRRLRPVEEGAHRFARIHGLPRRVRPLYKPILPLRRPPRPTEPAAPAVATSGAAALDDARVPLLHANCVPVEGIDRTLVCDLQRRRAVAIAPPLIRLLLEHRGETLGQLKARYGGTLDAVLERLLGELVDLDLVRMCSRPERLSPLSSDWEPAARVTNAVVDRDASSTGSLLDLFDELDALGCGHVLLRVRGEGLMEPLLDEIAGRPPAALQLRVEGESVERVRAALERWPRLLEAVVYGAPAEGREGRLTTLTGRMPRSAPQQPMLEDMAVNVEHFIETGRANSFFDRKVFVDARGARSNGVTDFGDRALIDLVDDPEFTALWKVTRDRVAGCEGCAMRRICVDPSPLEAIGGGRFRRVSACPLGPVDGG